MRFSVNFLTKLWPLLLSGQVLAVGVHELTAPVTKSELNQLEHKYSASILKDAELRYRTVEDGDDTAGLRLKFDGIWKYGEKRRGFKQFAQAGKLAEEIFRAQSAADYYNKLIAFHFDQELLAKQRVYLTQLEKTIRTLRGNEETLGQKIKLEEEHKLLLMNMQGLTESLQQLRDEAELQYRLKLDEVDFKKLVALKDLGLTMRAHGPTKRKTLTERYLEMQITSNRIQRDIKLNSEDTSLSFIEVRRSLPTHGDDPRHLVTVGVNLPFVGDETGMLMEETSFIEKKYKLQRDIHDHREEHALLERESLRQITLLEGRRLSSASEMRQLKKQAVKNLSLEEFSKAMSYEYARTEEDLLAEKEVYLNFVTVMRESGELLSYKNLLTLQKAY